MCFSVIGRPLAVWFGMLQIHPYIPMIQHPMEVKGTAATNGGGFSARGNLTLGGILRLRPRCSLWDPVGFEYLGPMILIYPTGFEEYAEGFPLHQHGENGQLGFFSATESDQTSVSSRLPDRRHVAKMWIDTSSGPWCRTWKLLETLNGVVK